MATESLSALLARALLGEIPHNTTSVEVRLGISDPPVAFVTVLLDKAAAERVLQLRLRAEPEKAVPCPDCGAPLMDVTNASDGDRRLWCANCRVGA